MRPMVIYVHLLTVMYIPLEISWIISLIELKQCTRQKKWFLFSEENDNGQVIGGMI